MPKMAGGDQNLGVIAVGLVVGQGARAGSLCSLQRTATVACGLLGKSKMKTAEEQTYILATTV